MTAPIARWIAPTALEACDDVASMWEVTDDKGVFRVTERRSRREGEADLFILSCSCGKWGCVHAHAAKSSRPDPDRHPRNAA